MWRNEKPLVPCPDGAKRHLTAKVFSPAGTMRDEGAICEGTVDILAECFGEHGPANKGDLFTECLKLLDEERCAWVVVLSGERVVAALATAVFTDAIHILNLAVDPEYQGQGVAKFALKEAQKIAISHNKSRLCGHVDRANASLLSLYKHLGCEIQQTGFGSKSATPTSMLNLAASWDPSLSAEDVTAEQLREWNKKHGQQCSSTAIGLAIFVSSVVSAVLWRRVR
eukprot:TRINITY_DN16335_c0_g1_i1.p1 TRINITY_DN16335_c0_g1~~TRINITY_DN16335_c0_g1_i1.p1  ORF type:complete len:226 (+),score=17.72 TRINITY_DN16335_c0_g1_i1:55-732(+)